MYPVTSLVQLSLEPEFRRGHGALYDALAVGGIDAEALTDLLVDFLPSAGSPRRPRLAHDASVIAGESDHAGDLQALADALAVLPAEQARARRRHACHAGARGPRPQRSSPASAA
ncbi:hypothetical protein ACWCOT_46110 [Nonomuraea bangladeshensis]